MTSRIDMMAAAPRRESLRLLASVRREMFLVLSAIVWIVLVVNFNALQLESGDTQVQYRFVQRLFGDVRDAVGYYFGLGLLEAPFYAFGKLLERAGVHTVGGQAATRAATALGLGLLTLVAWPLLGAVMRGMRLRYVGFALLAAGLGTPFFYYSSFLVGKNHSLDALLFAGVIYLVYRYLRHDQPERWVTFALGAVLGFSYTVRYFDGAETIGLVLVLALWRRWRAAAEIALTSAVVCLALFQIPHALGVPVFSGGNYSAENVLTFAPLNPLRMLFTNHRGYFVWSPVSVLAVIGLVLLFRRRPAHRRFLIAVSVMAAGVIASYSLIPFWDGTWAFGQRFYTPLFPVVAIGLAGLLDAAPRAAIVAATAAAAWSLFLAFNLVTIGGPQYVSNTPGGASDAALVPARTHTSPGAYAWGICHKGLITRGVFRC